MLIIKKFWVVINVPRHIKRYFYIKKIEGYTNRKNRTWILLINILIGILALMAGYYIFFINANRSLKMAGLVTAIVGLLIWMIWISFFVLRYEKHNSGITQLILKGEDGKNVKVWDVRQKTSLVIGKNTVEAEVDIDLSDVEYATLISKQHAVLNYSGDAWYVEDIGSTNGSGIKRRDENSRFRIEGDKPYPIHSGDIIYIANTKILVK